MSVEELLRRQAADVAQRDQLVAVTEKTYGEVEKGVADGPYACVADVDAVLGVKTWRPLHRFAVRQGVERDGSVKYRPCDNAGRSAGTNDCLSTHETIACEQPSFPVLVAALFAELGSCAALHHSTDDVELAL